MLVGTVPEKRRKKNMWKKKFPGADFEIKKKFSSRGVMVRGQFVCSQNSVGAMMSREDTTLKSVAPRMSCAVLAAAAW
jgi:hypothetical protein